MLDRQPRDKSAKHRARHVMQYRSHIGNRMTGVVVIGLYSKSEGSLTSEMEGWSRVLPRCAWGHGHCTFTTSIRKECVLPLSSRPPRYSLVARHKTAAEEGRRTMP